MIENISIPPLENWELMHYLIAVVAAGGIGVCLYFLMRYMKGSIQVILPKTHYKPGEMIEGKLELKTRKSITSQKLVIYLVGIRKSKTYDSEGKRRTRRDKIFEEEHLIEQERTYASGTKKTYEFQIPAPENFDDPSSVVENPLGKTLVKLATYGTQIYWELRPRLHSSGVDLAARKKIYIR